MHLKLVLLAGIAVMARPSFAAAQSKPNGPPRATTSTWSVIRAPDGEERSRTLINRTFAFSFRYITARPTDLLFAQEVRTTLKSGEEGDNGKVLIEAWAGARPDTGYQRRLWRAELDGSSARLLEDYYEISESGCCGAWDTRTYLSLSSGRPVATFTNGPVTMRGVDIGEASVQQPLSIVYLSSMGVQQSPVLRSDSLAFGELLFLEGDSVRSRVVLSAVSRTGDPMASAEFAVVTETDSVTEGAVYVRAGQHAEVRINSDASAPIRIPIVGRAFTLVGAVVPPAVRARISN